jgi:hypothetical protein
MSNAAEEAGKVASSAIDALKSQPMCLAVLILALAIGFMAVWNRNVDREKQHDELMSIYQRCFPLAGHEKI